MKVFAQHGHQASDKITSGLREGVIQGVIFSSRYLNPDKAAEKVYEARLINPDAEIFLDPEFYATRYKGAPNCQLGYLERQGYFKAYARRELVRTETVEKALQACYETVSGLEVSALIAPNIYVSQSFDSMEAGIALNFIENTKEVFGQSDKTVYATLAIDRSALLNPSNFISFLNDVTAMSKPPDGFYLLVGGGSMSERSDLVQSEIIDANVIGGWMLASFSLSQNGFRVINGFADILTPFLAAAGSAAGATGWWSNLRTFSMGRYIRADGAGGQLPIVRYLSKTLLNRIRFDERPAFATLLPEMINKLPHDRDYDNGVPSRTIEALQTWEALTSLNREIVTNDVEASLIKISDLIAKASSAYVTLSRYGITASYETTMEYFEQLKGGIEVFRKLAEL